MIATPPPIIRQAERCFPHGHTPGYTVLMCVTHLGNDRCRLTWRWRYSDSLRTHQFGGVVMCGKPVVSDPGDRRPR